MNSYFIGIYEKQQQQIRRWIKNIYEMGSLKTPLV